MHRPTITNLQEKEKGKKREKKGSWMGKEVSYKLETKKSGREAPTVFSRKMMNTWSKAAPLGELVGAGAARAAPARTANEARVLNNMAVLR